MAIKKNVTGHVKRKYTQFEETKQASEPDMEGLLELSDHGFKTTVINVLSVLMDTVVDMPEKMGSVSRETEILRK